MSYTNDNQVAWSNFVDVANDVKRWLQIPASDTTRDSDLQDLTDAACWWIQDQIGGPVAPTEFFRRFSGWSQSNGAVIMLPYFPVQANMPRTVVEYWGSSGSHTLAEQTPENQGNSYMYTLDPLRGIITRSFLGLVAGRWFPGLRNIEVTWWAGFNPVPPPIKMAAREYIRHYWSESQESSRLPGGRPGMMGGGHDDYADMGDTWPGVEAKILAALRPYQHVGLG